jgi:hypothetical protein
MLIQIYIQNREATKQACIGVFNNEEHAARIINERITKSVGQPTKLHWFERAGFPAEAVSNSFVIKAKIFGDSIPCEYFMWAKDLDAIGTPCKCGQVAVKTPQHGWWSCTCGAYFYLNHCFACYRVIDGRELKKCGCGWYRCTCGACKCTYT